jgi:hypothetical protein
MLAAPGVGSGDEVPVDLQRRRRVAVTEAGRDDGDGLVGVQQERSPEVAEVVEGPSRRSPGRAVTRPG